MKSCFFLSSFSDGVERIRARKVGKVAWSMQSPFAQVQSNNGSTPKNVYLLYSCDCFSSFKSIMDWIDLVGKSVQWEWNDCLILSNHEILSWQICFQKLNNLTWIKSPFFSHGYEKVRWQLPTVGPQVPVIEKIAHPSGLLLIFVMTLLPWRVYKTSMMAPPTSGM